MPPESDDGKPPDPIGVCGEAKIATGKVGGVLPDHGPEERKRHVSVVLRAEPCERRVGCVWGFAILDGCDDALLGWPDAVPDIESHRTSEQRTGVNQGASIGKTNVVKEVDDGCKQNERYDDCAAHV